MSVNEKQHGTSSVELSSTSTSVDNAMSGNRPKGPPANPRLTHAAARLSDAYVNSLCGALAGAASGVVTCPLDVIKTKLQAQGAFRLRQAGVGGQASQLAYKGMIGTAKTIWQQDGVRGMYRGLGPMLIGYLPTWAVYMGVYGSSKEYYYTKMGMCRLLVGYYR